MNRSHIDPPQMGISPIEPVPSPQVMGDEKAPIDGHIDQNTGVIVAKKSGAERKHVARLDAIFMVYAAVAQVLKYLDQQKCVALALSLSFSLLFLVNKVFSIIARAALKS